MYLLEIAAQGVRGFSPSVRVPLRPGYLVLPPPAGPAPLAGLLAALLYADGRGGESSFLAPGQKGKVGITLLGNDQVTYRVLRELGGAGALTRLNKTTSAFEKVSEDAAEITQYLRGQVGFPTRTSFEQLFSITAAQLPSRAPKKKPAAASAPGASGAKLANAMPVAAAGDLAAAEQKLADLEKEREHSLEVDQIQFKVDGIAAQVFELEGKLKGTEGVKAALKDAEAAHAAAPSPESLNLPNDIVVRAERYPMLLQRRDEALAKLETAEQPDDPYASSGPRAVPPLTGNQRFLAALGGGVAVLALGLFLNGSARLVALLDIPAFGYAALLALQYVEELQGAQQATRKGGMRSAREKKIRDDFDLETSAVIGAVKGLRLESPNELIELLGRKGLALQKVQQYRDQLRAMEQDPDYAQNATRFERLKRDQELLNQELTQKGAYVRDIREVEREIGRTKESIALAKAPPPAAPAPVAGAPAAPGETFEDPAPGLVKHGADLLQVDIPTLNGLIKDRCAQYLAALSDRRWVGIELSLDGKGVGLAADGKKTPLGELPARDLDCAYLALKLTLIEKICSKVKVPLILEEQLGIDEVKLPLLARMVKHLGTLTQILHVTAHPAFASVADATATL